MIMEDSGPEASKRQRLDSMNVLRVHSQHSLHSGSPPNDALHSYPVPQQPLAPPNAYTDPIPPSPYQTGPEPRHLSEHPVPGNAYLSHSGYSTPVREAHPPLPERAPSYSRNGHAATAAEVNHAVGSAQFDAVTAAAAAGAHVYPPTSARDADPSIAPYGSHDPAPNGMYHGLSMSSHHDTQSPPPAATTQYAEMPAHRPFGHPAPGGPPYSAGTYSAPAPWANPQAVGVRKPSRALQACETCRSRKAKCDEGKPKCSYCIENDHICKYKEVQPANRADRAQRETMDAIARVQGDVNGVMERMNVMYEVLMEMRNERQPRRHFDPTEATAMSASPVIRHPRNSPLVAGALQPPHPADALEPPYPAGALQLPHPVGAGIDLTRNGNAAGGSKNGSFDGEHSTAAHWLFSWPSVRRMFHGKVEINSSYVVNNEQHKGAVRWFGRGQGKDLWDSISSSGPGSPQSSSSDETTPRMPLHLSMEVWGSVSTAICRPNMPELRFINEKIDHPGGLSPDGTLKLDKETMYRLEQSYLDNMWLFHPIIDKASLHRMVDRVWEAANLGANAQSPGGMASASPRQLHTNPGLTGSFRQNPLKRKILSDEAALDHGAPGASGMLSGGRASAEAPQLELRIHTVIVLLVLALGKICEHTTDLPALAPEPGRDRMPFQLEASPAATIASPASAADGRGIAASYRGSAASGSDASGSTPAGLHHYRNFSDRNYDIVPGGAYFAKAIEMLGSQRGYDLQHAQAYILAALYTSQIASVTESYSYIEDACNACHVLARDPTFKGVRPKRKELILLVYWTCRQLEGDILAELPLHASGLTPPLDEPESSEKPSARMPYPASYLNDGVTQQSPADNTVHWFFISQIFLRGQLNSWQQHLYPRQLYEDGEGFMKNRSLYTSRTDCAEGLRNWRLALPEMLQWSDDEPPSPDINSARLRGKYWGAKYIIHRPFLYVALESPSPLFDDPAVRLRLDEFKNDPDRFPLRALGKNELPASSAAEERFEAVVQQLMSCRLCIDAAKRSTTAFDGIWPRKRLIVTNIFGTAQAQFSNAVVLAVVLKSHLHWLVDDPAEVFALIRRTMRFLKGLAPISNTMAQDAHMLEVLLQDFPAERGVAGDTMDRRLGAATPVNPNSSFSSQ